MRLTKHHGLGNDFLVLLDLDGAVTAELGEMARAACHRHRGVGADGLVHVTAGTGGADVTMGLYNADGGRAEMSGNGIACLAQAVVMAGGAGQERVEVATDAGRRAVDVEATPNPGEHRMRVELGPVTVGPDLPECIEGEVTRAVAVDVGNPHVVLHVAEPAKFPIEEVGRRICELTPGGANVEAVGPAVDGGLTMVVFERGVGVTDACGTGAGAAAAAAAAWGLVSSPVSVAMAGGAAEVDVGPVATLTTPIVHVATIDFRWR
jgi:diaminopimelate epimerase